MATQAGVPRAVAIYARISSDVEGSGLGVARQVSDCRALAGRLGWPVAEVYEDNDISAYSGKRRPAYERLLADLADGSRDGVIVYHVDRLTRRPIELEQFVAAVDASRVRHVRFVVGDSDIMTGDGLMVVRMLAAMAANESATKSRRVRRKMQANAEAGLPHGGSTRPFGYEQDMVTVREDEKAVVADFAERYLAGESFRSLAGWAQQQGIATVTGASWSAATIRALLSSARVAGLREHRGQVVGPAVWPELISAADRERILALMAQRTNRRVRSPRRYLLSGLVRCGRCEAVMKSTPFTTRRGVSERNYKCHNQPGQPGCGRMSIRAEPVEGFITDAVLWRLDSPELADAITGRAAEDTEAAEAAETLSADKAQLAELADLYGQRAISAAEWLAARRPIEARIGDAERRIARATRSDALTGWTGNGAGLAQAWPGMALTRQAAIISAVLDHVRITPATPGSRAVALDRVHPQWRL